MNSSSQAKKYAVPALGVLILLIGIALTWKPLSEARAYRDSIVMVFGELDRLQAERHRIAGLSPPKDHYASVRTQTELETLEARQNEIGNAIAKRIQEKHLSVEALSALEYTERKISDLRMAFEVRRKERLERFARPAVQKGCRWITCPDPFTLPGEAVVLKMKAENPDFGKTPTKIPASRRR